MIVRPIVERYAAACLAWEPAELDSEGRVERVRRVFGIPDLVAAGQALVAVHAAESLPCRRI